MWHVNATSLLLLLVLYRGVGIPIEVTYQRHQGVLLQARRVHEAPQLQRCYSRALSGHQDCLSVFCDKDKVKKTKHLITYNIKQVSGVRTPVLVGVD